MPNSCVNAPQVCKQFRNTFSDNPQRYSLLCLPAYLDCTTWDALSYWVEFHRAKVQHIRTTQNHCCSSVNNPTVDHRWTVGTLCLLPTFTALRSCCLEVSAFQTKVLDLRVLQSLQHLNGLALEGHGSCTNLHMVQHLTMLVINEADVYAAEDCPFIDNLQCLDVQHARVKGLHKAGVLACKQLRQLRCGGALIAARAKRDTLDTFSEASLIPDAMSILTALDCLHMFVNHSNSPYTTQLDLRWLTGLTNLTKLIFSAKCEYTLPLGMHMLGKLEELKLGFTVIDASDDTFADWQALSGLSRLHLVGHVHMLTEDNVSHLATAKNKTLSDMYIHVNVDVFGRLFGGAEKGLAFVKALAEAGMQSAPWIRIHVQEEDSLSCMESEKSLIV